MYLFISYYLPCKVTLYQVHFYKQKRKFKKKIIVFFIKIWYVSWLRRLLLFSYFHMFFFQKKKLPQNWYEKSRNCVLVAFTAPRTNSNTPLFYKKAVVLTISVLLPLRQCTVTFSGFFIKKTQYKKVCANVFF